MGRDRRNERRGEHWTKMLRHTMEEPAWQALSPSAQALYPWLKLEWRGPDANNNGKIELSVRQAAKKMGVSLNTAARAFHSLQAKGFIVLTEYARLGVKGSGSSSVWELTELKLPGRDQVDGRKLYRGWIEGRDYPVHKLATNNPEGRNGKTKPRLKNEDSTVLNFETKRSKPS